MPRQCVVGPIQWFFLTPLEKTSTLPVDWEFWKGFKPATKFGIIVFAFCLNGFGMRKGWRKREERQGGRESVWSKLSGFGETLRPVDYQHKGSDFLRSGTVVAEKFFVDFSCKQQCISVPAKTYSALVLEMEEDFWHHLSTKKDLSFNWVVETIYEARKNRFLEKMA